MLGTYPREFSMTENIEVIKSQDIVGTSTREEILANPGFGTNFTDHMVTMKFDRENGWHDGKVEGFDNFSVSPAMMVFHYGQAIFEGMKAYRTNNNQIFLFRPEKNASRFNKSATRMAMPEIDEKLFVESIEKLVRVDENWVPSRAGDSLYIRPFMVSSEERIQLRSADEYIFSVIAGPVSAYFSTLTEVPAISVFATEKYVRASEGGTGFAKCAGNYAASLIAREEAIEHDCQDVLWRDSKEMKYIEEMGTSNICFISRNGDQVELLTPKLTSRILDGITRDSILTLARDRGYGVTEETLVFDEVIEKIVSGEIQECFSCGTAVTVSPIGSIVSDENNTVVGDSKAGEITLSLRQELIDIQFGQITDKHSWLHLVP